MRRKFVVGALALMGAAGWWGLSAMSPGNSGSGPGFGSRSSASTMAPAGAASGSTGPHGSFRAVPAPLPQRASAGFATAPDRGDLVDYPARPQILHDGAYTWHRAALSERHALAAIASGRLRVTTPSGQTLSFRYQRHVEHDSGDWTWIGRIDGEDGKQAILTFGDHAVFGVIDQPGKPALKLTMRDGAAWLVETDPVRLALSGQEASVHADDFKIPQAAAQAYQDPQTAAALPGAVVAADGGIVTLDVLIGYSNGFAAGLGGKSPAVTRLNNLVDITNQAYVNSQVAARLRLVGTQQVEYRDDTDNGDALDALTGQDGSPDPAFAALRAARDQLGADLVSFVRKYDRDTNNGCGVAWIIGGGQQPYTTRSAGSGYSVVSDGREVVGNTSYFCREETLAHELGHNLGAQHDRATASSGGTLRYGAFAYSFGYKTDAANGNFYDIMAYGDSGQTGYRVFSNPRVSICGGFACGVENQADVARTFNQTAPIAAAFRATVVPPSDTATPIMQSLDYNGDGRSDLMWYHSEVQQIAYWLMQGATIAGRGDLFSGGQFRVVATGDFDGNGRADMLWKGPAGQLEFWLATASGIVSRPFSAYPEGWEVVDTPDLDGDGKSDLVWYHPQAQQVAYWIMNGAAVARSGDWAGENGYRIISTGDYNGDGKGDLLWKGPGDAGTLKIWFSSGSGYTAATLGSYPAGWQLIGSLDLDGDKRSDLVWYHPDAEQIAYWGLNGATISRRGDWFSGGGLRVIAIGDYNGDGRGDLVWKAPGASGAMEIWFSTGTSYTTASLSNYPAGWSLLQNRP